MTTFSTVKIHIKQMLTNGTILSDSLQNHPRGHEIDLTNSKTNPLLNILLIICFNDEQDLNTYYTYYYTT